MAFISPSLPRPPPSPLHNHPICSTPSRRKFLHILSLTPLILIPKPSLSDPSPGLPSGAREFSQVLSAQRQWLQLAPLLNAPVPAISDQEWDNLRGYLRAVYEVSGDMEFIVKGWQDKALKQRAMEIVKRFRKVVKGMDIVAIGKDIPKFRDAHTEVVGLFDAFFAALKEAVVGDIPDEL